MNAQERPASGRPSFNRFLYYLLKPVGPSLSPLKNPGCEIRWGFGQGSFTNGLLDPAPAWRPAHAGGLWFNQILQPALRLRMVPLRGTDRERSRIRGGKNGEGRQTGERVGVVPGSAAEAF